eukprot:CCRYP_009226-RA/>CCRYP_009226-RA protein AED:0.27 eAED:0.33 QI:0/0/0/1/0/0/4/0/432
MRLGEFARKCKEASCLLQSTEPYSPWSNSARRNSKGAARKLTRSGAPRRLWCFALEYEAYVRSHTAHDIYRLDGRVPRQSSLETADISPFCEFGFWDWVKFSDQGVAFPGDALVLGKYLGPSIDPRPDGSLVGTAHANPALDTRIYEVRFPDGRTEELAANVIAEAVYAQCDAAAINMSCWALLWITARDPSVAVAGTTRFRSSMVRRLSKRSTRGWELCCEWKDGSTSWQKLSDLKESHPLQVAELAFAAQIADEPAFNWWLGPKKRDRIVSLVKPGARYHKRTHKYGIELPKTVEEAYAIDRATGTTFWHDAIEKEMKNMRVAFGVLAGGVAPPADHQYIRCHMIFDVKMEDFRRKARLVAGGHVTKAPATLTYASVVSRETVRIALLIAALNDIDIWALMFLTPTSPRHAEKIWTTLGKSLVTMRPQKP